MSQQLTLFAAAATLVLLSACGGGGDAGTGDTPIAPGTPAVDKYVGTWSACITQNTVSARETLTITRTGDTAGTYAFVATGYASTNCSGTALATQTESGTVVLNGTKTIGSDTVDKGIVTPTAQPGEKQVFLVKGTGPVTLALGRSVDDGGTVDAEGYPNSLDPNVLTKQ